MNIQEFPWRGDLNRVNSEAESHYRVSPAASVRPRGLAGSSCERGWSPFYPMPRVSGARLWSEGNYRSETWTWFGRGRDRTRCRECLASDTTGQVPGDSHRLKRDYPTALIVVNYGVLLILLPFPLTRTALLPLLLEHPSQEVSLRFLNVDLSLSSLFGFCRVICVEEF